jgi:hypothetical protein
VSTWDRSFRGLLVQAVLISLGIAVMVALKALRVNELPGAEIACPLLHRNPPAAALVYGQVLGVLSLHDVNEAS